MDKKTMIAVAITAGLTLVVTTLINWVVNTSSAGQDAAERQRIEAIIEEQLKLPDGKSYGAVISGLDTNVAVLTADVSNLNKNVDLMRQAVQAIASDQ